MNTFEDGSPFPSGREFFEWCQLVFDSAANASANLNAATAAKRERAIASKRWNRERNLANQVRASLFQITEASQEHSQALELTKELVSTIEDFISREHGSFHERLDSISFDQTKQLESQEDNALHSLSKCIDSLLLAPQLPVAAPSLFDKNENGITAQCTLAGHIRIVFELLDKNDTFHSINTIAPGFEWPSIADGQWLPSDLNYWVLDRFSVTPSAGEFTMRSHKESPDALVLSILRSGGDATVRLRFNQQVLTLEDKLGAFNKLQIDCYRRLMDAFRSRERIVSGSVDDVSIYDDEGCISFYERVVDTIAPLAEELNKRSNDPSTWVIQGPFRQHRLDTALLKTKLSSMAPSLAKCFARIPMPLPTQKLHEQSEEPVKQNTQVTKAPNFKPTASKRGALAG